MNAIIEQAKELSYRFRGIKLLKSLFPQVYAQLNPNLILNDDALEEIDVKLIQLLNKDYFPCYDPYYDYINKTRERPYQGIEKLAIEPMGFNSYDYYYYYDGAGWYFVHLLSNDCFDYYGYDYNALSFFERAVETLPLNHPLQVLPDVVRYVWAMTGNLWLDSHIEGDNEFDLIEVEVLYLEEEYKEAMVKLDRLLFFDRWFVDNYACAKVAINKIMQRITNYDPETS
jgi:hypothetical protein